MSPQKADKITSYTTCVKKPTILSKLESCHIPSDIHTPRADNTPIPTTINPRTKDSDHAFLINPWNPNNNLHIDQPPSIYTE